MSKTDFINASFRGDIIGKEYVVLKSTGSTNDVAFEIGKEREEPGGIVIIADEQTSGRGRFGRQWVSPSGVNLYFTVLLRPLLHADDLHLIPVAASVAVAKAVRVYTGLKAEIKWPNDIIIKGKKAGGILVEMRSEAGSSGLVALGIGLNVNMSCNSFPEELKYLSTSLLIEGNLEVDRAGLLDRILAELEKNYNSLIRGDKKKIVADWLDLGTTINKKIRVQMDDRIISGYAEGINDNGELLVRLESGEKEVIKAGDVTILN